MMIGKADRWVSGKCSPEKKEYIDFSSVLEIWNTKGSVASVSLCFTCGSKHLCSLCFLFSRKRERERERERDGR